jgi:hypothetical protein
VPSSRACRECLAGLLLACYIVRECLAGLLLANLLLAGLLLAGLLLGLSYPCLGVIVPVIGYSWLVLSG